MHVNNQWYLKNMWQNMAQYVEKYGLTENICQHSAKSKISPTNCGV
jgi:hypothetical protein